MEESSELLDESNVKPGPDEKHEVLGLETPQDVGEWLEKIGQKKYVDTFLKNDINGEILRSLTTEELREDLGVSNLKDRRDILGAIELAVKPKNQVDLLPEHGRILDHLSNVRTFHSWVRVGVQLMSFSLVALRLFPQWRDEKGLVTGFCIYFGCVGAVSILYGLVRYILVLKWIEQSGAYTPKYIPDRFGVLAMLTMVIIAAILTLYLISVEGVKPSMS